MDSEFYLDDHRRLRDRVCEQAAAVINSMAFEEAQEDMLTDPVRIWLDNVRRVAHVAT